MTQAFPLAWPDGWTRTPAARRAANNRFGMSFAQARDALIRELELLKARAAVLSTNIELRLDGLPYAGSREPADPGVAIYFQLKGRSLAMARDAHPTVRENLCALVHAIEHLRGLERHGGGAMVERAFTGFAALPDPAQSSWSRVLGVSATATLEQAEEAYRGAARANHPDVGGNHNRMADLNAAIAAARQQFAGRGAG